MTEPLPDLETKLKGDVSDLVKAFAEASAAEKAYADENSKTTDTVTRNSKKQTDASADFNRLVTANMKGGQTALQSLQGEYAKTEKAAADFRTEFARSGSSESFTGLKDAEADLSKLKGFLDDAGQSFAKPAAQEAGSTFLQDFGEVIQAGAGSPEVMAAGAVLGAILAVPILAAVDGALSAGIGGGALAIGIAAAAKTPAVQAAFTGLKSEASSIFSDVGKDFEGPVSAGIKDITDDLHAVAPELKSTFAAIAPDAKILIDGVGGFVTSVLPGLEKGFKNAQPAVQELAKDLPYLGNAIGTMFQEFTEGGPGAVDAMHDLFLVIEGTVVVAGELGKVGGDAFHILELFGDLAHGNIGQFILDLSAGTQGTGELSSAVGALGADSRETGRDIDVMNNALNDFLGISESVDQATLDDAKALTAFSKGVKDGTKNWRENTAAGQANLQLLYDSTKAITDKYKAIENGQKPTQDQLKAELAEYTNLYNIAKAAGASQSELSTLSGAISNLTGQLNAADNTTAATHGLADSIGDVARQIEGLPPLKTVHINIEYNVKGLANALGAIARDIGGAANSGIVGSDGVPHFADSGVYNGAAFGGIYKTAENGPEANIAKYGDRNRALTTLSEAAGWFSDDINRNVNTGGGGVQAPIVVNLVLDSKVVATQLISPVNRMNGRSSTSVFGVH